MQENTVTLTCGRISRAIQIICRLYDSLGTILNGFDIDCCCFGWDGAHVVCTKRGVNAINTKINIVDLQIRGASYEARLLKYAERAFAIGVPGMDRSKLDSDHLSFTLGEGELEKCPWSDDPDSLSLSGMGWRKWTDGGGLEKLLLAESLAKVLEGVIQNGFPGRRRSAKAKEYEKFSFKLSPHPATPKDGYGKYVEKDKNGNPVWPATTRLLSIERGEDGWQVEWKEVTQSYKQNDLALVVIGFSCHDLTLFRRRVSLLRSPCCVTLSSCPTFVCAVCLGSSSLVRCDYSLGVGSGKHAAAAAQLGGVDGECSQRCQERNKSRLRKDESATCEGSARAKRGRGCCSCGGDSGG